MYTQNIQTYSNICKDGTRQTYSVIYTVRLLSSKKKVGNLASSIYTYRNISFVLQLES